MSLLGRMMDGEARVARLISIPSFGRAGHEAYLFFQNPTAFVILSYHINMSNSSKGLQLAISRAAGKLWIR